MMDDSKALRNETADEARYRQSVEEQRRIEEAARLRAFLYVLIRDHITVGAVGALMMDAHIAAERGADFSNQHLRDYVSDLIEQIQKGKKR